MTHPRNLRSTTTKTIELVVADHHRRFAFAVFAVQNTVLRAQPHHGVLLSTLDKNPLACRRSRKTQTRIPTRVCFEPAQGIRAHALNRKIAQQVFPPVGKHADPTIGQHHIRIKDLTRHRVHP